MGVASCGSILVSKPLTTCSPISNEGSRPYAHRLPFGCGSWGRPSATEHFQFVEPPSPCARLKDTLTTKPTTERLVVFGRHWTMRRHDGRILGRSGHPWTSLDSAPRAPKP